MNPTKFAALAAGTALLSACATLESVEETLTEAVDDTYTAYLTGDQVPGGGDPDGYARVEVTVSGTLDNICYEISDLQGVTPTAAHIHEGGEGVSGPPVVAFEDNGGSWTGCIEGSAPVRDHIESVPSTHYVQIHTAEYPNGAIRGQLYDYD
ncbi:CHRD domain-containing protein [Sphingomicrobium astaxanthinifaciens]|uniref:CHRD domain-containing protein n=1 Tax=Sphingomicrobium astaxanthinifaciens TaxID=1227949 RepID=UPI001FCB0E94|nr:CHRD domain-containing protein [Sphingomicrobium astaxanthinifaciens]MCJ7421607.1 CHRD domain-containing protein [Sphingomicrobium astaxanthinifaciens]